MLETGNYHHVIEEKSYDPGARFSKNLRKNPKFCVSFPKFMLSLSKVIKFRFSQNFKFNSLFQY